MPGTAGIGADFPHIFLHGRIDFRQLNGADRLLVVAIHKAFSVPIEEVQVWKQYTFMGEYPPRLDEATLILADSRNQQEPTPLEVVSENVYMNDSYGERDYLSVYGKEAHKVKIVDGELEDSEFIIGTVTGNEAGDPLYAYQNCYIRFPLPYLEKYLVKTRNSTSTTTGSSVATSTTPDIAPTASLQRTKGTRNETEV